MQINWWGAGKKFVPVYKLHLQNLYTLYIEVICFVIPSKFCVPELHFSTLKIGANWLYQEKINKLKNIFTLFIPSTARTALLMLDKSNWPANSADQVLE